MKVASEKQLTEAVNDIIRDLSSEMDDWEVRLNGLLTLESLVEICASTDFSALFLELIAPLPPIVQHQVVDRRSSVSRQACRTIAKLVMTFGVQVEVFAQSLQPALFKAQSMSINVLTEAANETCRLMMEHCHSQRLIPLICGTIKHDKNPRLRHAASEYLLLAMNLWEPSILERQMEQIESAILIAVRDALNETREAGRASFVELSRIRPDAAKRCLDRLPDSERSLKEKLRAEALAKLGPSVFVTESRAKTLSVQTAGNGVADPAERPLGTLGLGRPMRVSRVEIPSPPHDTSDYSAPFRSARLPKASPKDTSFMHRRPASASSSPTVNGPTIATLQASASRDFTMKGDKVHLKERAGRVLSGRAGRIESDAVNQQLGAFATLENQFQRQLQVSKKHDETDAVFKEVDAPTLLLETLNDLAHPNQDWEQRFENFKVLEAVLLEMDTMSHPTTFHLESHSDLLAATLRDGCSDTRLKISVVALGALAAALRHPEVLPGIEAHLESILSCLFSRFVDSREQLRSAAQAVLVNLPSAVGLEPIRKALVTVLQVSKSPKILSSVLDYSTQVLVKKSEEEDDDHDASTFINSPAGRALLFMGIEFSKNKNLEIRQAASKLLACIGDTDDSSAEELQKLMSEHQASHTSASRPIAEQVDSSKNQSSIENFEYSKGSQVTKTLPTSIAAVMEDENSSLRSNYQVKYEDYIVDSECVLTPSTDNIVAKELNDLLEKLALDPKASEVAALAVPSLTESQINHAIGFIQELMTNGFLNEPENADILRAALYLFHEILGHCKNEWPREESSKETILICLMSIQGHSNLEIAYVAFKCAEKILDQLSPAVAVSILLAQMPDSGRRPTIEKRDVAVLIGKLKLMTASLERLSSGQMEGIVEKIVPLLTFYYSSANADLRRAAVNGIVAVSLRVDEKLLDKYFSNLSMAQMKLIQIYVEKAKGVYES